MGVIIWLVGVLCCLWCIKDLWEKPKVETTHKVIITIALLCFSWVGLAAYYFIIKDRL